jgi:hypothetical protein
MPRDIHDRQPKLVDALTLLKELFKPSCRPSIRWLREQQRQGGIPSMKVGRLVFFDVQAVCAAMARNSTVK